MSHVGWDVVCYDERYAVYRIDGYNHSIGGKWGENCYWACPMKEKPAYDNLVQFSGTVCSWGMKVENKNTLKIKWEDTEMRSNYRFVITRNDEDFYSFGANDLDWGLSRARQLLFKVQEHPIDFNSRAFMLDIRGRKIYWREQPAIIKSYSMCGNLWIVPDGVPRFKKCAYDDAVDEYMGADDDIGEDAGIAEDIFSESIYWFRSKEYGKEG
jgi:hypothetical protein